MTEQEVEKLAINLRKSLFNEYRKFWLKHPNMDIEEIFKINSIVIGSLMAKITYNIFKKDTDINIHNKYIDDMCQVSKLQLKVFRNTIRDIDCSETHLND